MHTPPLKIYIASRATGLNVKPFILPHTRYESLLLSIYRYIPVHTITTFFIQVVRIPDAVIRSEPPAVWASAAGLSSPKLWFHEPGARRGRLSAFRTDSGDRRCGSTRATHRGCRTQEGDAAMMIRERIGCAAAGEASTGCSDPTDVGRPPRGGRVRPWRCASCRLRMCGRRRPAPFPPGWARCKGRFHQRQWRCGDTAT